MKKRSAEQKIAFTLRLVTSGMLTAVFTCKLSISEATFCRWKKQFTEVGVSEPRRLKQ